MSKRIRLTMAQAVVRYLAAQRTEIDGKDVPLVAGAFAIFGHGNVAGIGEALAAATDVLPTYRAHNEQGMALAAVAYAKATNRRQFSSSTAYRRGASCGPTPATCGVISTFGRRQSGCSAGSGSVSNTSRAAPPS